MEENMRIARAIANLLRDDEKVYAEMKRIRKMWKRGMYNRRDVEVQVGNAIYELIDAQRIADIADNLIDEILFG